MLDSVIKALIFILPAYVANGTPVVVAKLLPVKHPLDGGKYFIDQRRVLGNGKTLEGFLGGTLAGTLTAYVLEYWHMHTLEEGLILSLGALLGDLAGSFIKRRLGIKRGDPAPLLDQLDFLLGALALYYVFYGPIDPLQATILIVVTPVLHLATNSAAYVLGLKDKPW